MPHTDIMIPSSAEHTRCRRKSASSGQSLSEDFLHFYASSTDARVSSSSPTRFHSLILHNHDTSSWDSGHTNYFQTNNSYPSPPSTDSHLQSNVPLPPLIPPLTLLDSTLSTFSSSSYFGGILDSPLKMVRGAPRLVALPSPPPTLPTSTSSLPQVENDSCPFSPVSEVDDLFDSRGVSDSRSPSFYIRTPSSQSSCSTLQSPPPLSPVSPAGFTFHFSPSQFGDPPLASNGIVALPIPFGDSDGSYLRDGLTDIPESTSPKRSLSLLSIQPDSSPPYDELYADWILSSMICDSPQPTLQDLEPEDATFPPFPFCLPSHDPDSDGDAADMQAPDDDHEAFTIQQQTPLKDQIQESSYTHVTFPHMRSPSLRGSSLPELDDFGEMDLDLPDFPSKPPSSPSRRSYSALPDLGNAQNDSLPPYPELDRDTSTDIPTLSPFDSPSLTVLGFPGADTDEDLIPLDLAPTKPTSPSLDFRSAPTYTHPLLALDDEPPPSQDSSQRSPSPEPCTMLDMNFLTPQIPEGDEEVKRVCRLLKRTKDKERTAIHMERITEDEEKVTRSMQGASSKLAIDAWNRLVVARRKTKKMRETVREVATLLRLKLAQRGWKIGKDELGNPSLIPLSPPGSSSTAISLEEDTMKVDPQQKSKGPVQNKQRITSPQQLLVKMIMDRHEPRYNPDLRTGILQRKLRSPLASGSVFVRDEDEIDSRDMITDTIANSPLVPEIVMNDVGSSQARELDDLAMNVDLVLGTP
ncbi:hypothetical protein P691DRAFT_807771 [Macrolepiota fuliginosa MF-IS2]|uniref:Uncharacterized protein n=1 Tax=Macrolepiota fuliginosa MF-IS2 TaxID=1400762 RepID=A0A9P5X3Z9_9AGAR|nr:hypothetical protein P691DRAFT_807771 [Macrolepiota fuliginosa MF-IS2]